MNSQPDFFTEAQKRERALQFIKDIAKTIPPPEEPA
jgi:hypothetical protein